MSKVKLQYKTAVMKDSATKQVIPDKRRPYIANLRIYNLDELVKFALDNNYIEGAKYELAKGIVKGAIEAERALILAGNAVSIDNWVKYEPRLKGSVSADKRTLTKDNGLVVGISALKELKLPLDTFSWQCVDPDLDPDPEPTPDPDPDPEPEPTPTGPTVTAIDGGEFHDGTNVVTGANMRFADAYPAAHVRILTGMGEEVSAMIGDDDSVEAGPEQFALSISVGQEMTPGAEYTFEFAMLDEDGEPVTVTQTARWRAA